MKTTNTTLLERYRNGGSALHYGVAAGTEGCL